MTRATRLIAAGAILALSLVACGRASTSSGPSVASVYSGRVVLNDLNPVVRDLPSWWDGPPTFDVKPLNSATRPDFERFAVVIRFALGTSLSGPKAGDQVLYYNQNAGGGAAPYISEALVRVGETVIVVVWARVDAYATTSSLGKVAATAATRLKSATSGKLHVSPAPSPEPALVAPQGPDLTLLGTARLPVEVVAQMLVYPAPMEMTDFFHHAGVSDFVYGDYAVNADTRMEILTAGFTFSSPTGSKDWITAFYGGSSGLSQGVYLNFESDTGQYVGAFGNGTRGVLVVCRSSAPGEQAGRSCESSLVRVIDGWRASLAG
ncbi:MAG: hypothetical protein E6I29_04310 [Chloroflexi bacterium]|nr:MAG: hypothetical protein E6I29_04310 [Chloroflexota bacterium]